MKKWKCRVARKQVWSNIVVEAENSEEAMDKAIGAIQAKRLRPGNDFHCDCNAEELASE
jgi:hypothetical protein